MKDQHKDGDSHLQEIQLEGAQVKLLDVRRDRVQLANGHESIFANTIMHQGAVVIIPVLENGNLLFERQSRHPLRASILELPAGKIDPGYGESVNCAKRLVTAHVSGVTLVCSRLSRLQKA